MSETYFLLRDDQAVSASTGTTTTVPRKFRRQGIGLTRSNAELELRRCRQTIAQFPGNERLCQGARETIAALEQLLSPEQSETDIRRELSAEHRKLEARGGDPTRHQQLVQKLRKTKRAKT